MTVVNTSVSNAVRPASRRLGAPVDNKLPEQAFYFVGGAGEVEEKAKGGG